MTPGPSHGSLFHLNSLPADSENCRVPLTRPSASGSCWPHVDATPHGHMDALHLPGSPGAHARLIDLLRSAPTSLQSFSQDCGLLWPLIASRSHSFSGCSSCGGCAVLASLRVTTAVSVVQPAPFSAGLVLCRFSSKHPGSPPPTAVSQWALRAPWQLQGRGALGGVTGRHLARWQHTDNPSTLSSGGPSLGLVRLPFFCLERRPQHWGLGPEWLGDINMLAVGRP